MSRLSRYGADPEWPWRLGPPHLRRNKGGKFECRLHPRARILFHRRWYPVCSECYEFVTHEYGRKHYTTLRVKDKQEPRCVAMSRTRAARIQPPEED